MWCSTFTRPSTAHDGCHSQVYEACWPQIQTPTSTHLVLLVVDALRRESQEVLVNDGRPNGELLLSTGTMQDANLADCLMFKGTLVPADRWDPG